MFKAHRLDTIFILCASQAIIHWRSILAYDCMTGECGDNPSGKCTRLLFFSSHDLGWDGRPMGDLAGAGVGETDNARRI